MPPREGLQPVDKREEKNAVLVGQLNSFLFARADVRAHHQREKFINPSDSEKTHRFLGIFYTGLIEERNRRADEFNSPEVITARSTADQIMPLKTYGVTCMDSRVMRTIMFGLPLGHGGFLRIPSGKITEITPSNGEKFTLMPDKPFTQTLEEAFLKSDYIAKILDSHIGCAAQKRDQLDIWGKAPEDDGLFYDVIDKKYTADAIKRHVVRKHHIDKRVFPIQTSFDPHNGFLYMGLETPDAIIAGKRAGNVFTSEVREQLVNEGKILYTKQLAENPTIKQFLEEHTIENFDWSSNYRNTMAAFWKNMEALSKSEAMEVIKQKVSGIFRGNIAELHERAMLLALNIYNAYHLNKSGSYPYGEHEETVVVVSEGENGPYAKNPAFSVHSDSTKDLDNAVRLAASIVRDNRISPKKDSDKSPRISDTTGEYPDAENFVSAPVPATLETIIRGDVGTNDWDMLNRIMQLEEFVPNNWHTMNSDQFKNHIRKNIVSGMPLNFFDALDTLRKQMIEINDPTSSLNRLILEGQIEMLPVLVDNNREIRAIVPFIYKGYREEN